MEPFSKDIAELARKYTSVLTMIISVKKDCRQLVEQLTKLPAPRRMRKLTGFKRVAKKRDLTTTLQWLWYQVAKTMLLPDRVNPMASIS